MTEILGAVAKLSAGMVYGLLGAAFIIMSLTGGVVWIDGTTRAFSSEWYRLGSVLAALWFLRLNLRREVFETAPLADKAGKSMSADEKHARRLGISLRLGITFLAIAVVAGLIAGAVAFPLLGKIGFLQGKIWSSQDLVVPQNDDKPTVNNTETTRRDIFANAKSVDDVIKKIIGTFEGGFVNNPQDPGGAVNLGITMGTLSVWRGREVTVDDLKSLTPDEAIKIYKDRYVNSIGAGYITDARLRGMVIDFSVHSGPVRAVKKLKDVLRELGVPVSDDSSTLDPDTVSAINEYPDPLKLAIHYACARAQFLRGLSVYKSFGKALEARVAASAPEGYLNECPLPNP